MSANSHLILCWIAVFGCVVHHIAFDGYSEHLMALSISNEYNTETKIKVNNSKLDTPIIFRNPTIKNFYNTFEDLDSLSKKLNKCVEIKWSDHDSPKNDSSHYYKLFNLDKLLRLHQDNPVPKLQLKNLQTDFLRQPYFNIPFDLHAEIWPIDKNSLKLMLSYKKIIPEELINKIVKRFIGYLNSLKAE